MPKKRKDMLSEIYSNWLFTGSALQMYKYVKNMLH